MDGWIKRERYDGSDLLLILNAGTILNGTELCGGGMSKWSSYYVLNGKGCKGY